MNDWYIDRAKYFIDESTLLKIIQIHKRCVENSINYTNTGIFAQELIKGGVIPKNFRNPNARITNYRDHGLLTMENKLNNNCYLLVNNQLSYAEFIIDLMLKRGSKKNELTFVNPTIIIAMLFNLMIANNFEKKQIYLTKEECFKFLYPCSHYFQIKLQLVNKIIESRMNLSNEPTLLVELNNNETINLNIWFTALSSTPFFDYIDKTYLVPNFKYKSFFEFLYENCFEFENAPADKSQRYEFLCNNKKGLFAVIPDVITKKCDLNDTVKVLKYLFGINDIELELKSKYFGEQVYGVYNPFISIPRLVINKLIDKGKLDNNLYSYDEFKLFLKEIIQ